MGKAKFSSGSYRKQRLREEEGSLEKQGGEKNSQSMGMGPKENSSDSRCGNTLYTLTHTCKEDKGKLEVMRAIK